MSDKTYSTNESEYRHDSLEEALGELNDEGELELGGIATVWEGDPKPVDLCPKADWLIEAMQESAYGAAGEFAEDFLEGITSEQAAELQTGLKSLIDNWLDAHKLQPTFYTVINTREVKAKITELSDSDFKYEIVAG